MKWRSFFACALIFLSFSTQAQTSAVNIPKGPYNLPIVTTKALYQQLVNQDNRQRLVELNRFIPGLVLDIRYATPKNLAGEPVYNLATAYARQPVAEALKAVQEELKKMGLGLKIYDGYRPYSVTVRFYEKVKDTVFVASPRSGSRHNRGCAIDLTIIRLKDGKELNMPTEYDAFTPQAHSAYANLPKEVIKNRDLLKQLMLRHGFQVYPDEWWHFDFKAWQEYPLMDLSFEELRSLSSLK